MRLSRRDVCIQGGLSIITTGFAALTSGCGAVAPGELEPVSASPNQTGPSLTGPAPATPALDGSGPLLSRLTATDFAALNGSVFLFQTGAATASTRLIDVAVLQTQTTSNSVPASAGSGSQPTGCYQLVFEVPEGARFEQATYPVFHPQLGSLDLFVVPEARRRDVEQSAGSAPNRPIRSLLVATIYQV